MSRDIDELDGVEPIGKPAQQRAGVKPGERVPDATLESAVLDGSDIHYSLRDLAMRGRTVEQLQSLMDQSEAKGADPARWRKRYGEIPRLVSSAAKKQAKRAQEAFGAPPTDAAQMPGVVQPPPTLPTVRPADMVGRPLKRREWIALNLIPKGEPTLVYGKGAAGKSLLLYQLAICIAAGCQWLGLDVPIGRVLFYTAEDSVDELNRRATDILKALGKTWADCGDRLLIVPMRDAEADATLATPQSNGVLTGTPTYDALKALVADFRPDVTIVDTLADTFAGNENVRAEAKQFVRMLVRLRSDASVIVTAHLSVSAEEDGRGFSGSTGWPAAVRASLTFGRTKKGQHAADRDVRLLENKKSNYAPEGEGAILMRWREGAFVPIQSAASITEEEIDTLFLDVLRRRNEAKRWVSDKPGSNYAPSRFAEEREFQLADVDKPALKASMERLFTVKRIANKDHKGANGRVSTHLTVIEWTV